MHTIAAFSCVVLWVAAAVSAQDDRKDPERLVRLLDDPSESRRKKAADDLLALGAAAVRPLTDALPAKEDPEFARRVLRVLRTLGPTGGAAVPELIDNIARSDTSNMIDWLRTIGDLVPYRAEGVEISGLTMKVRRHRLRARKRRQPAFAVDLAFHRLQARAAFPLRPKLDVLFHMLEGYRPYRVELAVELLAQKAAVARAAIPGLAKILHRPDPRVPRTERTIPLREAAAKAILKIAPASDAATRARAVLAGEKPVSPREIPKRAKARIAELIADLESEDAKRSRAASKNLIAYGKVAVPAIVKALPELSSSESRSAALLVIRRVGKDAAMAARALIEVITEYPAEHTAEIFETLAEIAPWSRDVLIGMSYSYSVGNLRIFDTRIGGDASYKVYNKLSPAYKRYCIAAAIDVSCTIDELRALLEDRDVWRRDHALRLLRARRLAAKDAVSAVLKAMRESHPKTGRSEWLANGSARLQRVSRDDAIHRLAAQAILAIVPQDKILAAEANAVLERLGQEKK